MAEHMKCLHCGHEYTATTGDKQEIRERICPKCKSNSVRKLSNTK